uniref:Cytochrome c oxidase subunit 2 n=1 Tax=Paraconotrochus antarcticus TaxID=2666516 RepID=A0A7T1S092_9CNID|nr:cytochrome c oxidase subunit II [Paraconotrochus antarcticus]QPO84681.1 cytochrome c oxidase subunit II [Paraconotrochus antarcticus]
MNKDTIVLIIEAAKGYFVLVIKKVIPKSSCRKDLPEALGMGLQDAASPIMEEVSFFHDQIMFLLIIIIIAVLWLIMEALIGKFYDRELVEGTVLEIVWTIVPAMVLVLIALPSLRLLYFMDEVVNPALTIKAIGHQWYWAYEYSDYEEEPICFDSYMTPVSELAHGDFRLLEVDQRLFLPIETHIRILVTGADVLHSFGVPALGLKTDAVPGRLNQTGVFIKRPGTFFGQCSEICGANHSFMPIVVEAVSFMKFTRFIDAL